MKKILQHYLLYSSLIFYAFNQGLCLIVNLRNKNLKDVPTDQIDKDVVTLRLSKNKITNIPGEAFQGFIKLKTLDISDNQITEISQNTFFELPALESINLKNNRLTSFPYFGYVFATLVEINLANNPEVKLTEFSGYTMNQLQVLDLENTGIYNMPESIANAPQLELLNLKSNNISTLPNTYFKPLEKLKILDLSDNFITQFNPATLSLSSTLEELMINAKEDFDGIAQLESGPFQALLNLQRLELKDNSLLQFNIATGLSAAGTGLISLKDLVLTGNRFISLTSPGTIPSSVEHFRADNMLISDIAWDYFDGMGSLKELNLTKNLLTAAPVFNDIMPNLVRLSLSENQLVNIPDGFFEKLPYLEALELNENRMSSFEIPLDVLSNLKELNLENNLLREFLISAENLASLETINLIRNKLSSFEILSSGLSGIKKLYLDYNRLEVVPTNLSEKFPSLEVLSIERNRLTHFEIPPPAFNNLKELYLDFNDLTQFPDIKSSIGTLTKLYTSRNQIEAISMGTIYGNSAPIKIAGNLTHLDISRNSMLNNTIDDNIWATMPKLQYLYIYDMNLKVFPNLQSLENLEHLRAQSNIFGTLGNTSNLAQNKKLKYIKLNPGHLSKVIDFVELAESYTSTQLKVYIGENKLNCNEDICWLKKMDASGNCLLSTTVTGTDLLVYTDTNCQLCHEPAKWNTTKFSDIEMVDLGCGDGIVNLDYGPEIPLNKVDLHQRLVAMGSDSNLSSCFDANLISNDGPLRLKFTYTNEAGINLPLTLVGHNLACNTPDDIMLLYMEENSASGYRLARACTIVSESVVDNRNHCQYECKCLGTTPCEIYLIVIEPGDKILCDIILTGSYYHASK